MLWRFFILFLWLGLFVRTAEAQQAGAPTHSQPLRLPVQAFTADNGLGGATITSLYKDARGFLWVGTPDELLLYDGGRFQPFRYRDAAGTSQSFRRAYTFGLAVHGVLILHEEGAHHFALPSGRLHRVPMPVPATEITKQTTLQSHPAQPASFLLATTGYTALYNARNRSWSRARRHPPSQLPATSVTPAGRTGLACDTVASARVLRIRTLKDAAHNSGDTCRLPFRATAVLRLAEGIIFLNADGKGALWWMPTGGSLQLLTLLHGSARDICAAYGRDGFVYLAAGQTLVRFSPASGKASEILAEPDAPLVRQGFFSHLLIEGHTLWAGTNATGLIRVSLDGPRIRHLRADSAVLNWTHGIFPDLVHGRIYVGGYWGTVAVFDTSGCFVDDLTPRLRRASTALSAYINAIEPLPDGRLLIASGHNSWVYNPATGTVENLECRTEEARRKWGAGLTEYIGRRGILRAGPWEWWMSEKPGLVRWRLIPAHGTGQMRIEIAQLIHISPPVPEAFCRYAGSWWCATAGRLYRFNERGLLDSFRYPLSAFATCLAADKQERLWIATESGIAVWRGGKTERILTTDDGLPNNHVYTVLPDSTGQMWGSTNNGLFAVRTDDFSVRAFTGGDGLQGAEFNLGAKAIDAQGRLYFGGMNGVNIVDPAVALREDEHSAVTFTRIAGADTVYYTYPGPEQTSTLRLPHDRASLQLSFTAPQPGSTSLQRFEYRLRENDTVWTDNGNRQELQLFLAPGKYRVEVRVKGAPSTVAQFEVEVTPPFYRSWWFIAILAVGGAALVTAALIRAARRRYRRELAALETARHIQEEKERISRELHDELGARAALLAHNASLLREETIGDGAAAPLVKRITDTTADMLTALRETVWTLKQEAVTLESLWVRYKNFVAKLAQTYAGMRFVIEEEALPAGPIDYGHALNLLRTLQEAIMNAVKHAGPSVITVAVKVLPEALVFSVMDNGRGFNVAEMQQQGDGNGLQNMGHRSKEGGFRLDIRSGPQGTVVEVAMLRG